MAPESSTKPTTIFPMQYTRQEHYPAEQKESTQTDQSGLSLRGMAKFSVLFAGYVVALTMLGNWRAIRSMFD